VQRKQEHNDVFHDSVFIRAILQTKAPKNAQNEQYRAAVYLKSRNFQNATLQPFP
jgi:hypothetical protein